MTSLGSTTLGSNTLGLNTLRSTTLGSTTLGSTTLGSTTLGSTTLGSTTLGSTTLGSTTLGSTTLGANNNLNSSTSNTKLNNTEKNINTTKNIKVSIKPPVKPKKVNESAIALKIKQMQEQKKLIEEAEQKRLKDLEILEQQTLKEEKIKKQKLVTNSIMYQEQNKILEQNKKKQDVINKSIAKYGYDPTKKVYIDKKIIPTEKNLWDEEIIDDNIDHTMNQIDNTIKSPVICVLGSINAGKTHLLDKIRSSSIYATEAGSITQSISASYIATRNLCVPGLILIDTPGHEPFANLRSRASNICDIAILIVDLMVGIKEQTIECIHMLVSTNKKFVIALNKIDLLYNYDKHKLLMSQSIDILREFHERTKYIKMQLQTLGYNTELYDKITDDYYQLIPISAITGEGIDNLLNIISNISYKQQLTTPSSDDVVCTVLETNYLEGHGMVIHVILTNGVLKRKDQIMLYDLYGKVVTTTIKNLMIYDYEHRRGNYEHCVKGSITCTIMAPKLDNIAAGSNLYLINDDVTMSDVKDCTFNAMTNMLSDTGIFVCASTLGAVEAIVMYFTNNNVAVCAYKIGNLTKKDVLKSTIIVAFNVVIDKEIKEYVHEKGIVIFEHNIIYTLFDMYMNYVKDMTEKEEQELENKVIFPCALSILSTCIFNKQSPIILGVHVDKGVLKINTPIYVNGHSIGKIKSIEKNNKNIIEANVGDDVCIMIEQPDTLHQYSYGRHFTYKDVLYSKITRESIDAMKIMYPDILTQPIIFKLVKQLKILFNI